MFFWENFSTWTRLAEVTENKNAIKFRQKITSLPGKSPWSKSKHFFFITAPRIFKLHSKSWVKNFSLPIRWSVIPPKGCKLHSGERAFPGSALQWSPFTGVKWCLQPLDDSSFHLSQWSNLVVHTAGYLTTCHFLTCKMGIINRIIQRIILGLMELLHTKCLEQYLEQSSPWSVGDMF